MKIIVDDEIYPEGCPFYIEENWHNELGIDYEEGCCKLLDSTGGPGDRTLYHEECRVKKGGKCPFCITYDEFKRRMEEITEEK